MEVSGSAHNLGDSFSYGWLNQAPPSLDRLAADAAGAGLCSFGSSRSSFIDMDPGDLFSMRWTTGDFDFGLQGGGGGGVPPAAQLVSASQIFRDGRLLPCEPGLTAAVQPHGDGSAARPGPTVDAAPGVSRPASPLLHSAQSTPLSLSATSKHGRQRPVTTRRGGSSSPWKVLLRYVRFLMPLYRKARALAPARRAHRRVAPAGSPSRGSTSSVEWCHGSADTAVHDAILYCKKSIGKDALPAMKEINR